MTTVKTYRSVVLAAVTCAWVLGHGGQLAHAAKKSKKTKSKQLVGQHQFPYLMVLNTKRNPSDRVKDEYFRRMTESNRLALDTWWVLNQLQAKPSQVAARAGQNGDGYVWVSEPKPHKRLMVGGAKTPVLELGAVREVRVGREVTEAEVGRYRCAPSSYERYYQQHQKGAETPLPDVVMIDPYVRPEDLAKDARFKERELKKMLELEPSVGKQATRITASFANEHQGSIVDSLHFQLPRGRELCFSVDRPLVVSEFTYPPQFVMHTRDNPQTMPRYGPIKALPPPEKISRMLNLLQLVDQGSPLQGAVRDLLK